MGLFIDAINKGNVAYSDGSQVIDTTYSLGDGNHRVTTTGSKTNVVTGNGSSTIASTGSNCTIQTGNGNQKITSIGDNNNITTGDGDDNVVFIGDNTKLDAGNGNNKVIFWGDNVNIKTGNGNDSITTFDQEYKNGHYSDISQVFIDKLPTGTWEKWNKVSTDLIDYNCKTMFFRKRQTWTYEEHYDVETIFSRYINGVKNTKIDMGGGNNSANVTLGEGSTIGGSGNNDIKYNEKWQIDKSQGHRDEVKIRVEKKSNTRWGNVAIAAAAVGAAVVGGIAIAGAASGTAAGGTAAGAAAGSTAAGGTAAAAGGTAAAAGGAAATGGVVSSIGAGVSSVVSGIGSAVGAVGSAVTQGITYGLTSMGMSAGAAATTIAVGQTAISAYSAVNAGINIAKGNGSFGDWVSLIAGGYGAYTGASGIAESAGWVSNTADAAAKAGGFWSDAGDFIAGFSGADTVSTAGSIGNAIGAVGSGVAMGQSIKNIADGDGGFGDWMSVYTNGSRALGNTSKMFSDGQTTVSSTTKTETKTNSTKTTKVEKPVIKSGK